MTPYNQLQTRLQAEPKTWLVTGVAGFIGSNLQGTLPTYRDFRAADVRHSLADIRKASTRLGSAPTQRIDQGLALAMPWYIAQRHTLNQPIVLVP